MIDLYSSFIREGFRNGMNCNIRNDCSQLQWWGFPICFQSIQTIIAVIAGQKHWIPWETECYWMVQLQIDLISILAKLEENLMLNSFRTNIDLKFMEIGIGYFFLVLILDFNNKQMCIPWSIFVCVCVLFFCVPVQINLLYEGHN